MSGTHPLQVLHITDLHLYADPDAELYGVRTNDSFRAVVQSVNDSNGPQPDVVLVTGDIAEDCSPAAYERFASIVATFGAPVLCLPGNHDDPDAMARVLNCGDVSFCASRAFGDWRFVMLSSHVTGDDGGRLGAAELERLQKELAAAVEKNLLVAVHHQPLPMGSAWLDDYGLRDAPEFLTTLSRNRNVRVVVWGHVHQASDREHEDRRMLSTPSTCAQFTPGTDACLMDTRPPGFRRIALWPDGRVETRVEWLENWVVAARPPDSRQPGMDADH